MLCYFFYFDSFFLFFFFCWIYFSFKFNPPIKNFLLPSNLFFYFEFHPYFFNYYFFVILDPFVLLIFVIPFHSSTFNLLGLVLYHFSMYNASSLMTWVTSLKSWHGSISSFSYFFFLS